MHTTIKKQLEPNRIFIWNIVKCQIVYQTREYLWKHVWQPIVQTINRGTVYSEWVENENQNIESN